MSGGRDGDALVLRGCLCDIEAAVSEFVQTKARQAHLSNKRTWELLLALDEICSSLVAHNGCTRDDRVVRLSWQSDDTSVTICVADNGVPFNPLQETEGDADDEEEARQLGGMSRELLYRMVDEITYEHKEGWNCLTLRKHLRLRR